MKWDNEIKRKIIRQIKEVLKEKKYLIQDISHNILDITFSINGEYYIRLNFVTKNVVMSARSTNLKEDISTATLYVRDDNINHCGSIVYDIINKLEAQLDNYYAFINEFELCCENSEECDLMADGDTNLYLKGTKSQRHILYISPYLDINGDDSCEISVVSLNASTRIPMYINTDIDSARDVFNKLLFLL